MADAHDSKSCIERCEGSSPSSGTMHKKVLVIVGPTASGKSDLAVSLAKSLDGEVISADSRQVYKGLDVGSGKITKKEMRGIPHHLLDIVSPKKIFTAAEYRKLAKKAIEKIIKNKKIPIIVGGTGFYIDALMNSLPDVPPNPKLRKKLETKSLSELVRMLGKHEVKDKKNKVRLIRAIEIVEALGDIPKQKKDKTYKFVFIGLNPKDLESRIEKRLKKRIPKIIIEVKKLHKQGLTWKRMYELGLEYRYVSLYVQGKLKKMEMEEKLLTEIRKYAKRQKTWFKRNKEITWLPASKSVALSTTLKLLG